MFWVYDILKLLTIVWDMYMYVILALTFLWNSDINDNCMNLL